MCGAELGFAKTRCMASGESLIAVEREEGGEVYAVQNARRTAKLTGFFVALMGLLMTIMGLLGIWMYFTTPDERPFEGAERAATGPFRTRRGARSLSGRTSKR